MYMNQKMVPNESVVKSKKAMEDSQFGLLTRV
jgi:hypothetical protein